MSSMYKEFIHECTDWTVIERDKYFFCCRIYKNMLYIRNLYIKPEFRDHQTIFQVKKCIRDLARRGKVYYIAGHFEKDNPFYEKWLRVCKNCGFTLLNHDYEGNQKFAFIKLVEFEHGRQTRFK